MADPLTEQPQPTVGSDVATMTPQENGAPQIGTMPQASETQVNVTPETTASQSDSAPSINPVEVTRQSEPTAPAVESRGMNNMSNVSPEPASNDGEQEGQAPSAPDTTLGDSPFGSAPASAETSGTVPAPGTDGTGALQESSAPTAEATPAVEPAPASSPDINSSPAISETPIAPVAPSPVPGTTASTDGINAISAAEASVAPAPENNAPKPQDLKGKLKELLGF
ncbi:hypothetical protein M1615_02760 [Patescibacteria group bacterium]|nr:hypothetical protein [Patescibacteria group bacterium]